MSKLDLDAVKAAIEQLNKSSTVGESMQSASELGYLARNHLPDLIKEVEALREALGWFVDDDRFQVGVGGNPNVVEAMIAEAKARHSSDTLKTEQEAG